jgi:DNA replication protein DnaC
MKSDLRLLRKVEGEIVSPPSYVCQQCKDKSFVRANVPPGHPQFGKAIECECTKAKRKARHQTDLLIDSGILNMKRFQDANFEAFQLDMPGVKVAYTKARAFADEPVGWLVLVGAYGCGKTHLAAAIARTRVEAGDTVLIQTVPDLLDYLRSAYVSNATESYDERFEAMKKADLLVLDDYGTQNDTGWTTEKIFQLLNYRYNMGAATVITSNNVRLSGIDPRIYSRLHDQNLVSLVRMENAGDYRMRNVRL